MDPVPAAPVHIRPVDTCVVEDLPILQMLGSCAAARFKIAAMIEKLPAATTPHPGRGRETIEPGIVASTEPARADNHMLRGGVGP